MVQADFGLDGQLKIFIIAVPKQKAIRTCFDLNKSAKDLGIIKMQ